MFRKVLGIAAILAVAAIASGTAALYWQARQKPVGKPTLVALGSSFAAGLGLGERVPGSPFVCQRGLASYPRQLASMRNLSLVDMTCSGATSRHVLSGGQVFLSPQIDGLSPETQWVTLTIGDNDIGYVGDLSLMAGGNAPTFMGWAIRHLWGGPKTEQERDFAGLRINLQAILATIKQRSPRARIIVATYPAILPASGTCARIGLTSAEADMMRQVSDKLSTLTVAVANEAGAIPVEMHRLGAGHDACSREPWVNGWYDVAGTPFHPNMAGARATAVAISAAMGR